MIRTLQGFALAAFVPVLVGCSTPTPEQMAEMMRQPARPAELERLATFVGQWSGDATVHISGMEPKTSHGRNTTRWADNGWMLVEEWEHEMGPDSMMKGMALMWWDAASRTYQMRMVDNYGGHADGTMRYNEETGEWTNRVVSHDREGAKTIGKGWMKLTEADSMQWSWTEYDSTGLFKILTVEGTSTRS